MRHSIGERRILERIETQQLVRYELQELGDNEGDEEPATPHPPLPLSLPIGWHGRPQQPAEFLGPGGQAMCRLCLREWDRFAVGEGDDWQAADSPVADWPSGEVARHTYARVQGEAGLCERCVEG